MQNAEDKDWFFLLYKVRYLIKRQFIKPLFRMNTEIRYQFPGFKLNIQWNWKELGLGFVIVKPHYRPFPHKNFWIKIAIRLLWLGIFIAFWDRKSIETNREIYDQKQRMKEISAFHYKELIVFASNSNLNVSWIWNHLGIMVYYQAPKERMHGCISLDLLWFSTFLDFMFGRNLQVFSQNDIKNSTQC
jgi:hypothetical protein